MKKKHVASVQYVVSIWHGKLGIPTNIINVVCTAVCSSLTQKTEDRLRWNFVHR